MKSNAWRIPASRWQDKQSTKKRFLYGAVFLLYNIISYMKKFHVITFGCQMNKADSERLSSALEKKKYKPVKKISEADLIMVNMCSVRQSAVNRVFGVCQKIAKLKKKNKKLKTVLTGCILKNDARKFAKFFDEVINQEKARTKWPYKKIENSQSSVSYVPISNGCNYSCSYCVVPTTRGRLQCFGHNKILQEVKNATNGGAKEIWLLGQNVNDYTSPEDHSVKFPKLLKAASKISGNFSIRFMSPNPNNFSDELINVMADSPKIANYLNIPLQSGDNKILKEMKRPYTVEQYKTLIKKIRQKMPSINLSTDIIVGFPDETKKQFTNTAKLMKEIKFNIAYISKYSARKGTAAYQMKDNVPIAEKKRRWQVLDQIVNA